MVKENRTAKKSRYISVKNDAEETYVENIPATGSMKDHRPAAQLRLREIQRLMPLGKWSITIEQEIRENGRSYYQILDVKTGKLEEVTHE